MSGKDNLDEYLKRHRLREAEEGKKFEFINSIDMEENETAPLLREDKILSELKQLKRLFTVMLGTEDQPAREKLSKTAIIKGHLFYL